MAADWPCLASFFRDTDVAMSIGPTNWQYWFKYSCHLWVYWYTFCSRQFLSQSVFGTCLTPCGNAR